MKFALSSNIESGISSQYNNASEIFFELEDMLIERNYGQDVSNFLIVAYIRRPDALPSAYKWQDVDGSHFHISYKPKDKLIAVFKKIDYEAFKNASFIEQQKMLAELILHGIKDVAHLAKKPQDFNDTQLYSDVEQFCRERDLI